MNQNHYKYQAKPSSKKICFLRIELSFTLETNYDDEKSTYYLFVRFKGETMSERLYSFVLAKN